MADKAREGKRGFGSLESSWLRLRSRAPAYIVHSRYRGGHKALQVKS